MSDERDPVQGHVFSGPFSLFCSSVSISNAEVARTPQSAGMLVVVDGPTHPGFLIPYRTGHGANALFASGRSWLQLRALPFSSFCLRSELLLFPPTTNRFPRLIIFLLVSRCFFPMVIITDLTLFVLDNPTMEVLAIFLNITKIHAPAWLTEHAMGVLYIPTLEKYPA